MTSADLPKSASHSKRALLGSFSLEMTGKDVASLQRAAGSGAIPPGTRVHITYLATEDDQSRLAAVHAVRDLGFTPVAHIAARRMRDESALREYLEALQSEQASPAVFLIGGDPPRPEGPYPDALSVIRSGILEPFGVREVGISGYPEGHPDIPDAVLWQALEDKAAELEDRDLEATIITQFCFDADPVLSWLAAVRERGITAPIRIGVPGPAGIKRLLGYARRFGVGTSAEVVRKYGFSLTSLLGTAGPDAFLHALADGYDPAHHGDLTVHFYAFGGLAETADWVNAFGDEEDHR